MVILIVTMMLVLLVPVLALVLILVVSQPILEEVVVFHKRRGHFLVCLADEVREALVLKGPRVEHASVKLRPPESARWANRRSLASPLLPMTLLGVATWQVWQRCLQLAAVVLTTVHHDESKWFSCATSSHGADRADQFLQPAPLASSDSPHDDCRRFGHVRR